MVGGGAIRYLWGMSAPSKHRQALTVWLCIYPTITLVMWAFGEPLAALPLPLRTLVLTAFLVPTLIYVLVPFANRTVDRVTTRKRVPAR